MDTVRTGVIGAGAVAQWYGRDLRAHPRAELLAVADLSAKRARAYQKTFTVPRLYKSAQDLLADDDLDAVCVALPNSLHEPVSAAALRAGKHVFLEKPFARNAAEAKRILQAARKAKRVLMVGMNLRYLPEAQMLRTLVARGDLGEVYHARATYLRRSGAPKLGTWFTTKQESGGGCMLDIGVHVLDASLFFMDNFRPRSVAGAVHTKLGPQGRGEGTWGMSDRTDRQFDVDDFATALIRLEGGATVELSVSWALHQAEKSRRNIELFGTKGGAQLWPFRAGRFGRRKGEYELIEPQGVPVACSAANRMVNWVDVILGEDEPVCSPEQSLVVQRILDAVYASAHKGREVRVQ